MLAAVTVDVDVQTGGAVLARPLLDSICALYDEVFSAPPFLWWDGESELHRQHLLRQLDDPTFGIAVATAAGGLIGFAYGDTVPADTMLWSDLVDPVRPELTAEWPGRTFFLSDYAVRASWRGQGLGRKLHGALLRSRNEQRAALTVQPAAIDTKRIYEHWGWRQIGQVEGGPTAVAPVFDVYLRDGMNDWRTSDPATPR